MTAVQQWWQGVGQHNALHVPPLTDPHTLSLLLMQDAINTTAPLDSKRMTNWSLRSFGSPSGGRGPWGVQAAGPSGHIAGYELGNYDGTDTGTDLSTSGAFLGGLTTFSVEFDMDGRGVDVWNTSSEATFMTTVDNTSAVDGDLIIARTPSNNGAIAAQLICSDVNYNVYASGNGPYWAPNAGPMRIEVNRHTDGYLRIFVNGHLQDLQSTSPNPNFQPLRVAIPQLTWGRSNQNPRQNDGTGGRLGVLRISDIARNITTYTPAPITM